MMKTKITRISKRSLSMVLALLMMVSIIMVGTITANAYDFTSGKTVYFDNSWTQWSNVYLRVGKTDYSSAYAMSKVSGTNNIYSYTIPSWGGYAAFSIANNQGWTGSNSIYKVDTGDSYDITASTNYMNFSVSSNIFVVPKSTNNSSEGCQYYNVCGVGNATASTTSQSTFTTLNKSVSVASVSNGTVTATYSTGSGGTINEGNSASILYGSNLTVTQTADSGYKAADYTGACVDNSASKSISNGTGCYVGYHTTPTTACKITGAFTDLDIYVNGIGDNWNTSADNKLNHVSGSTYSRTFNFTSNQTFKIYQETSWYGRDDAYTFSSSQTDVALVSPGSNLSLTKSVNGDYVFTYNSSTKKLSITFPYTATAGSVTHGTLKVGTSSPATGSSVTVSQGSSYYITATPNTGYNLTALTAGSDNIIDSHSGATSDVTVSRTMGGANETVNATFTANTYTVTLNTNGGTISSGDVTAYTYGVGATLPTSVTKTGYDFGGWYDNSELTGSAVNSISTTATGNKSYWAKWTPKSYSITYKDKGNADFTGTHETGYPTTHTYGTATTLDSPTRNGYSFEGWFTTSACTGTAKTELGATEYTNNITLYAKWEEIVTPTLDSINAVANKNVNDTTFNIPLSITNFNHKTGTLTLRATSDDTSVITVSATTEASAASTSISAAVKGPGTATITVELYDDSQKMNEQTVSITVTAPTFTIADKTITAEASGVAAPTVTNGGTAPTSIAWSSGTTANVAIDSSTGALTAKKINSSSTITATATYACGYTKSDTCTVTVANPTLTVSANRLSGVVGNTATASVSASNPSSTGIASYAWSTSDDTVVSISSTSAATPTLTFRKPGTATISLTATYNNNSLTKTSSFEINVAEPTLTMSGGTIAKGDSFTLSPSFTNNAPTGATWSYEVYPAVAGVSVNSSGEVTVAADCAALSATIVATATQLDYSNTVAATLTIANPSLTITDTANASTKYLTVGTNYSKTLSNNFSGTYTATSSNMSAATVAVAGNTLTVTPVAKGVSTITVTATKSDIIATQTFTVYVANNGTNDSYIMVYGTYYTHWSSMYIYYEYGNSNTGVGLSQMTKIGKYANTNDSNYRDVYIIRIPSSHYDGLKKVVFNQGASWGGDHNQTVDFTSKSHTYIIYDNETDNKRQVATQSHTISFPQVSITDVEVAVDDTATSTLTNVNNVTPGQTTWSTANASIATVSDGTVTGVDTGTTDLTAKVWAAKPDSWGSNDYLTFDNTTLEVIGDSSTASVTVTADDKKLNYDVKVSTDGTSYNDTVEIPGTVTATKKNTATTYSDDEFVPHGTDIVFTATENAGYKLVGWEINGETYNTTSKEIHLTAHTTAYALYDKIYTLTITGYKLHGSMKKNDTTVNDASTTVTVLWDNAPADVLKITPATGYEMDYTNCSNISKYYTVPSATTGTDITFNGKTVDAGDKHKATITIAYKLKDYSITTDVYPSGAGSITVSKASGGAAVSTAKMGETLYFASTATANSGYELDHYEVNNVTETSPYTMVAGNKTIKAVFRAITPVFTALDVTSGAHVNESYTFNAPSLNQDYANTTTFTYKFNNGSYQDNSTFTMPSTAGTYTLKIKATNNPGTVTAATYEVEINVVVKYHTLANIDYYIDMHDKAGTSSYPTIAIVNSSGDVVNNNSGNSCSHTMVAGDRVTNSTIYKYQFAETPNFGDNVYVKISYSGTDDTILTLSKTQLENANSGQAWFELTTVGKTTFKRTAATYNDTEAVASGTKRVYFKLPSSYVSNGWGGTIGIHYWGGSSAPIWDEDPDMKYLGYASGNSSNDKFFYFDVPADTTDVIFRDKTNSKQTVNIALEKYNYWTIEKNSKDQYEGVIVNESDDSLAVVPTLKSYTSEVDTSLKKDDGTTNMTFSVAPDSDQWTGASISFSSSNTSVATVNADTGVVEAKSHGTTTITMTIKGTVGLQEPSGNSQYVNATDYREASITVNVNDATKANGFGFMSYQSETTTYEIGDSNYGTIDKVNVKLNTSRTVDTTTSTNEYTGLYDAQTPANNIYKAGMLNKVNAQQYTVRYAKTMAGTGYTIAIKVQLEMTANNQAQDGHRWGFDHWDDNGNQSNAYLKDNDWITADGHTYTAVFAEYQYIDAVVEYRYYDYNVEREDGKYYQYDNSWAHDPADWVANNNITTNPEGYWDLPNSDFGKAHNQKSYTVTKEYRYGTGRPEYKTVFQSETIGNQIAKDIADECMVKVNNNYYHYKVFGNGIKTDTITENLEVKFTVYLVNIPKKYKVTYNNTKYATADDDDPIYYQSYLTLTAPNNVNSNWYKEVTGGDDVLLGTGESYRFRVGENITIKSSTEGGLQNLTGKSIVHHAGHSLDDDGGSTSSQKLTQNFYIADFFNTNMKTYIDYNDNNREKVYDEITFVGGGVVYYSVNSSGTPKKNEIVSNGFADSSGIASADNIKAFLKQSIERGETDVDELAKNYNTEISTRLYKNEGGSTGLAYRYLPLNQEQSLNANNTSVTATPKVDGQIKKNSDIFRYSDALKAYQYYYGDTQTNNATNAGTYYRVYSYFIYSYVTYDEVTDEPVTNYEVVLSENYADAERYVDESGLNADELYG